MDQTMPATTTKAALLNLAGAFGEVWNAGRDALAASDALQAAIAEEERNLAHLRQKVAELHAEHERLAEPLKILEELRKETGSAALR